MSTTMKRVCSVLPSATEVLCVIGCEDMLVGRSHEDNYPECITDRPILTGQLTNKEWTSAREIDKQVSEFLAEGKSLYILDEKLLQELRPDVILTQDICAVCAIDLDTVRRVAASIFPKPKVVSLNPQCLQDVLEDLVLVGHAVDRLDNAEKTRAEFEARVAKAVSYVPQDQPRINVAFIEWSDPIYVGGHWTPQIIKMAGGHHPLNPCGEGDDAGYAKTGGAGKSFAVHNEKVVESDPDIIIICPCGLDIPKATQEAHNLYANEWFRELRAVKAGKVYIVDGDAMFNRPGPRLVDALEWLVSLLQDKPEIMPENFPYEIYNPKTFKHPATLPDIEEIHRAACADNALTYKDPATDYSVITELGHKKRGFCCGHRCRHCPYGHFNVDPAERLNKVQKPTYLKVAGSTRSPDKGVDVLFWSGGKDSYLTYLTHKTDRKMVLLTTFTGSTGMIQHQGVHHHEVMAQAKHLKVDLILAPLPESNTNEEYLEVVRDAVAKCGSEDVRCLFGDLHLTDIKNWREKHHDFPCLFPVFKMAYPGLQDTLLTQPGVTVTISASSTPHAAVGTAFTKDFIASLPSEVDSMGENGEFHTLVKFS
eukprot:TRINITY_DN1900_c0_g1_i2.p1 TRINITY_DN1900_c0_g1~~TRINITY_DN1900_c0_g1_i2.p1  ORF type:complete len:594 (+),score=70.31 TRINITY_DN1900_c0_g1_i2:34-1815(+)